MLPCGPRDAGLQPDVAKRIVMAASRLLGAMAAYVIVVSFAAGYRNRTGMAASRLRYRFVSRFC